MKVEDIQPGQVFQTNHEQVGDRNDIYLILDSRNIDKHIEVRWVYISGRYAGMTFRTLLQLNTNWGDTRIT